MRTKAEIIDCIIEYFEEYTDLFTDCIEELDSYNGYLGDDRYYSMCDLDEIYHDTEPTELLHRAFYGYDADSKIIDKWGEEHFEAFNPNRDYFSFNGYGNLVSTDYKDYSVHLDSWAVESMNENRRHIYSIEEDVTLSEWFDLLEECEE